MKEHFGERRHLHINDETINKYMDLITERSPETVYAFNTFFYTSYATHGFSKVCRWTKNVDIFSKNKLFFPIHINEEEHWCLACVDFKNKVITYYDSLGGRNFTCLKKILQYLLFEHLDKKNANFEPTGWALTNERNCPRQMNLWDCGIFVCMFAEYLARDVQLTFSQKDMKMFRRQMKSEIKKKKLINSM